MRFRLFPKIPTHRAAPPRAMGGPWVALEKLHGAQLVVASDGGAVHVGKRKAWLAPDEPFFGWQLIAGELAAGITALAAAAGARQVVAFGELIGGAYPHSAVAAVPGLSAVQTGIWYTPAITWVPFDVLVAGGDDDDGELLAHHEVEALAATAGVRTPPRLARGTRSELERVDVRFTTHVPAWFGLPALANNLAEGIVLKPDARCAPDARPVIKRKLPEFSDDRFAEAEAWNPGRMTERDLLAWVERMIQPARIASARSKVGTATAAIVDEVALDVSIDLGLAFADAWSRLAPDAQERVVAHARAQAEHQLTKA
jgi:Rnl2 family RNA ligase